MMDVVLQIGVSNLTVSLLLAIAAAVVQAHGKRPVIAHLLWVLVLVKLVTPPIVSVPLVPVPGLGEPNPGVAAPAVLPGDADLDTLVGAGTIALGSGATDGAAAGTTATPLRDRAKLALLIVWVAGSLAALVISLIRVLRFNGLLAVASKPAAREIQDTAREIGQRLGIRSIPEIVTTSAHLSPMVWWIGGRLRVILPERLCKASGVDLRWILAHELAHVRRRDHIVRWVEWLASVSFWWNPVAWWSRRNLRINEEICCDARVMESLSPAPRVYAGSLLKVVEFLSSPAVRPPAMASAINSGSCLERRFRMILSDRPTATRRGYRLVLLVALALLPLGVAYSSAAGAAQKSDPLERVKAHLKQNELTEYLSDETLEKVLDGMRKLTYLMNEKGEDFKLDPDMRDWFVLELGLTHEQLELVVRLSQRIAPAMKSKPKGPTLEGLIKRGIAYLEKNESTRELSKEQLKGISGAMHRMIPGMQKAGDKYELDARLRIFLVERIGLDETQLDLVVGISRRLSHAAPRPNAKRSEREPEMEQHYRELGIDGRTFDAILEHYARLGISKEKLGTVMGVTLRGIHHLTKNDDAEGLDPKLVAYLEDELGLNEKQIQSVEQVAQKFSGDWKKGSKKGSHEKGRSEDGDFDWKSVIDRIEGAVKRGEMTREEADAEYLEIKKRLAQKRKDV